MSYRKSQSAADYNTLVNKAVQGVHSRKYKSLYKAAKYLGLSKDIVIYHVNGGLLYLQAHQQQQKLLYT